MKDQIRWGMIGCGAVAQKKSGPAFYKARGSSLYAVTSADYAESLAYAEKHPVKVVYRTADELLADPNIDAVYLATPPRFHKEYAVQCAKAGKAAYIEKPLANTYSECLEIIREFEKAEVKGYTAFYRRAMDKFQKIKAILEDGIIGNVRFVNVFCQWVPEVEEYCRDTLPWRLRKEAGGGKFLDMSVHCVDILEYLIGNFQNVFTIASNQAGLYDVEDIVSACFQFDSGPQGSATWCFSGFRNEERTEIVGDKGMISFSVFDNEPFAVTVGGETKIVQVQKYDHVQQPMIQLVVDDLLGKSKCPSTLYTAAHVTKIVDQMLAVYREQNHIL